MVRGGPIGVAVKRRLTERGFEAGHANGRTAIPQRMTLLAARAPTCAAGRQAVVGRRRGGEA
jgi:hypothetical protein